LISTSGNTAVRQQRRTNDERAVEIENAEVLVRLLVQRDRRLLVDAQPRLLPVPLHVHQVPEVVVERVCRHLLQRLDAVADVEAELDHVANWTHRHRRRFNGHFHTNLG